MSLQSKKLPELKKYASALSISLSYVSEDGKQHHKKKSQLINDIEEKVDESKNSLYKDWMKRVDERKTIWKSSVFDAHRHYSLPELQNIARNLGLPFSHMNRGDLIAEIQVKTHQPARAREEEEKYERISKMDSNLQS